MGELFQENDENNEIKDTTDDGVFFHPYYPGRIFRYLDSGSDTDVFQRAWQGAGNNLTHHRTLPFFERNIYRDNNYGNPFGAGDGEFNTLLAKDANGNYVYKKWLDENYDFAITINDSGL